MEPATARRTDNGTTVALGRGNDHDRRSLGGVSLAIALVAATVPATAAADEGPGAEDGSTVDYKLRIGLPYLQWTIDPAMDEPPFPLMLGLTFGVEFLDIAEVEVEGGAYGWEFFNMYVVAVRGGIAWPAIDARDTDGSGWQLLLDGLLEVRVGMGGGGGDYTPNGTRVGIGLGLGLDGTWWYSRTFGLTLRILFGPSVTVWADVSWRDDYAGKNWPIDINQSFGFAF
jgi:hypothetical protein